MHWFKIILLVFLAVSMVMHFLCFCLTVILERLDIPAKGKNKYVYLLDAEIQAALIIGTLMYL